jgi:hypothetical protein
LELEAGIEGRFRMVKIARRIALALGTLAALALAGGAHWRAG